jgi:hypothetical protein
MIVRKSLFTFQKRKKKDLTAESMTWRPAPEVDDAAANDEPSFRASGDIRTGCHYWLNWFFTLPGFYHFQFHSFTSSCIGICRAPHLGAL